MNLRIKKILFAFTLIITGQIVLNGQNYSIRSYNAKNGLPHDNVRAIARDSTGFIWLATWDGLSRFDGYEFRNYLHQTDDSSSLPFFSVNKLTVDSDNNLWILTDIKKVTRYNRESDNFSVINNLNGLSEEEPVDFLIDQGRNFYLITHNKIIRWDENTGRVNQLKMLGKDGEPFDLSTLLTSEMYLDENEIWLIEIRKVLHFRRSGDSNYMLEKSYPIISQQYPNGYFFDFRELYSVYKSESGRIWISSNAGIYGLDDSASVFRELTSGFPLDEFTGKKYFSWGSKNNGIFIYEPGEKELVHVPVEKARLVTSIMPLGDNSIWFGNVTTTGVPLGINHLIFNPGYFKNYLFTDADSAAPAVYSITMDKDRNIWTGIRGYDHILQVGNDDKMSSIGKLPEELFRKTGHIRSMIATPDGIWIGYYIGLLRFYDYRLKRFTDYFPASSSFRAIAMNEEGNFYVGNFDLTFFTPTANKTDTLWHNKSGNNMFRIYIDDAGTIYATMSGAKFLKYNKLTGVSEIIVLLTDPCNIEDIIPGETGELWMAFLGEGVCRYNINTGRVKFYTTSSGLSNNTTYNLLRDQSGNIWVSTNNGISRINPETERIRKFGRSDGLEISEFNSGAKFQADDGEFFFGGMGGFVRFYPDSIVEAEEKFLNNKILFTHFEVSGDTKTMDESINESDTIVLNKGETNFHLSFAITDFVNSNKTIYRFRLSDVSRDWTVTGPSNRNINYSNLTPGWYDLEIEAADPDGNWSISEKKVFRITPYFYQSIIFLVAVPIVVLCVISFSIFTYISQLKQRARQTQDELKLQSLRGQMNPHFIFNSLNSINYFISNNDKLSANRYIGDFSRLIRSILYNLGNEYIPIENEIESLKDYLNIEHLRYGDRFNFTLDTESLDGNMSARVFPGLVQPFIENAIWHGVRPLENRKGMVTVRFSIHDQQKIKCTIEDDGVGRTASEKLRKGDLKHQSKGIAIATERLSLIGKLRGINYELNITDVYRDRYETGTRVVIDLPVC